MTGTRLGWPGLRCRDCRLHVGVANEWYMVHDEVWPLEPEGGLLCIGCLEARIGRSLVSSDFTDCPANTEPTYRRSLRLRARLGGGS
jgi:hypothetical protein